MKKKLVAVLLAVVLVSANLLVLTACQPTVTNVTFNTDDFKTQYIVPTITIQQKQSITVSLKKKALNFLESARKEKDLSMSASSTLDFPS